jgi:hypothetical protein
MDHVQSVVHTERQVLRALCQGSAGRRTPGLSILRSYRWREPVHQVIFELLIQTPDADPELIREQLPARLTRRGFPDFDLALFQPHALTGKEIESLIDRLRKLGD